MRKSTMFITAASVLLGASHAAAQEFGKAHTFAVGAERVAGFTSTKSSVEIDDQGVKGDIEVTNTNFALLANKPEASGAMPRVGVDFFVIDSLSIGGFIGYASDHEETDYDQSLGAADGEETKKTVLFGGRVGYYIPLAPTFGIWPRGGPTYVSHSDKKEQDGAQDNETTASVFLFSVEGMLVYSPFPHVSFIGGPTADISLSGSGEMETGGTKYDLEKVKETSIGVQAGIVASF